jgi:hypothetical protein
MVDGKNESGGRHPTHQEADSIENVVRHIDGVVARLFDPADADLCRRRKQPP